MEVPCGNMFFRGKWAYYNMVPWGSQSFLGNMVLGANRIKFS
jgi:hypothetical protein